MPRFVVETSSDEGGDAGGSDGEAEEVVVVNGESDAPGRRREAREGSAPTVHVAVSRAAGARGSRKRGRDSRDGRETGFVDRPAIATVLASVTKSLVGLRGARASAVAAGSAGAAPAAQAPATDAAASSSSRKRARADATPGPLIPPNIDLRELITSRRRAPPTSAAGGAEGPPPGPPLALALDTARRPPLPLAAVVGVKAALAKQRGFASELEPPTLRDARDALRACKVPDAAIPPSLLVELRRHLLAERCRNVQSRVFALKDELLARYAQGKGSIVDIALALGDLPPVACARVIFQARGVPKNVLRKALTRAAPPPQPAHAAVVAELERCKAKDCASWASVDDESGARAFERELERMLRARGVRLSAELRSTEAERLTPDILVHGDFRVDGFPVKWLDAKNFLGGACGMLDKSTRAQALKYVERFGPGAVVYSAGVTTPHVRPAMGPDVALLDVEWLRGGSSSAGATAAGAPASSGASS